MVVVEDDRVDEVLEIIKHNAKSREQYMTPAAQIDNGSSAIPINVQIGGARSLSCQSKNFYSFKLQNGQDEVIQNGKCHAIKMAS